MTRSRHVRNSGVHWTLLLLILVCAFAPAAHTQQTKPEDPEDEKQFGLWLDQAFSVSLTEKTSVETEVHERLDENASNLFEYFFQGGVAFRPRSWLMLLPVYRYQRFPANPRINYENRLLFNTTLSASGGPLRYNLRVLVEGRFPDTRPASARLRFRPGIDYPLPIRTGWRPTLVLNNEFFLVPWFNPFANGGSAYTQNRFQAGVRLTVTSFLAARPYYMLQSVSLSDGWDTNQIIGLSLAFKIPRKLK